MRMTRGHLVAGLLTLVGVASAVVGGLLTRLEIISAGLALVAAMSALLAFTASRRASAGLELLAEIRTQVRDMSSAHMNDPFRQQVRNHLDEIRLGLNAQAKGHAQALDRHLSAVEVLLQEHSATHRQHLDAVMAEAGATSREADELLRRRVVRLANQYEKDKAAALGWLAQDQHLRDLSRRSMAWLKSDVVREVDAIGQLRPLLGVEVATPLLDGWAMDPVSVYELVQLVMQRKPRHVVELGSGASTLWLGHALRRLGAGHAWSFDHLAEFGDKTAALIASHGLQEQVEVCVAPLAPFQHGERTYSWYDIPEGGSVQEIDLLLVDGPPGSVGSGARFPALPAFASRLRPDARIVVDDAHRPDEKEVVSQWMALFPALEECAPLGPRTRVFAWRP